MFKIKHKLNKLSFIFSRTGIRRLSRTIPSDDEVESLNNELRLLKLYGRKKITPDLSFKHDPIETSKVKQFEQKEIEDLKLKHKITKISEAQRVCIQEDEDISNYKLVKHTDEDVSLLLDAIFEQGTNYKFVQKLDKICEFVNEDELKSIAGLHKPKIEGLEYVENDLSDIEESINAEVEKFFENATKKLEISKTKVKTIEDYLSKTHLEKNKNEVETKSIQKKPETPVIQSPKINNLKNDKISEEKRIQSQTNLNFINEKEKPTKNIENPLKLNIKFKNFDFLNPSQNDPERKEKFSVKEESVPTEDLFKINKNKTFFHLKNDISESIESKFQNYLLKKNQRVFDQEYFKSLNFVPMEISYIQKEIINKNYSFIQLFTDLYKKLCQVKKYTDKKTKKVFYKNVISDDPLNLIKNNYIFKVISGKYNLKLFNETLLSMDKNRIDLILLKLKNSKENVVNFLLAYTKANNGENYGVITIFDGQNQSGSILINLGKFTNPYFTPLFLHIIAFQFIELIQLNPDSLSHIKHFNIVTNSMSFNLESHISLLPSDNFKKLIIMLIESKLEKFKTKIVKSEILDGELNFKESSYISNIPNIKFFNYRDVNRRYILQYLNGAKKLEANSMNIKL